MAIKLEITQEEIKGVQIIGIKGRMDDVSYPIIERLIMRLFDNGKYKILIDMKNLEYMNSAGWVVFIGNLKQMRDHKGDIKLCRMNDSIYDIFKQMGLDYIIHTYSGIEEGIKAFKKNNT